MFLARVADLEENWVAQECEEGTDVGEGVEPVGRDTGIGDAEPLLHQRTGGGEDEVREPDRNGEEQENVPRRIAGDVGFPGFVWSDGEQREGQQEEAEVEHCLRAGLQQRRGEMRIRVATQQHRLKEEKARRPDAGTPAEPREDVFADERLDLEKEESTGENAKGEGEHEGRKRGGVAPRSEPQTLELRQTRGEGEWCGKCGARDRLAGARRCGGGKADGWFLWGCDVVGVSSPFS